MFIINLLIIPRLFMFFYKKQSIMYMINLLLQLCKPVQELWTKGNIDHFSDLSTGLSQR